MDLKFVVLFVVDNPYVFLARISFEASRDDENEVFRKKACKEQNGGHDFPVGVLTRQYFVRKRRRRVTDFPRCVVL